jgi:hypothetical protein
MIHFVSFLPISSLVMHLCWTVLLPTFCVWFHTECHVNPFGIHMELKFD